MCCGNPAKSGPKASASRRAACRNSAPLSTCFTAAATPSVLSRSVRRRTPAPARSRASMFKCWSMLLGSPITGTPAANACCVVGLPPLQSTTAERAAAASPGR